MHDCALRLLARRAHSQQELAHKLATRGFSHEEVEMECERLLDVGLLDDLAFSHGYIRARANRGLGPVRIKAELAARGVDRDTIATALEDCDIDWSELRSMVEAKKRRQQRDTGREAAVKRARFLHYRGFGGIQAQEQES